MTERAEISCEGALRRLLAEIATGDYLDVTGRPLAQHGAYVAAVATLELIDLLGEDP